MTALEKIKSFLGERRKNLRRKSQGQHQRPLRKRRLPKRRPREAGVQIGVPS